MLDKKSKFKWFYYLNSKWVRKQPRQLTTSATHLAQKLLMNVQCRDGSSFAKETESLDDEEPAEMVGHRKLTVTNWEPSSKLSLLKLHEKLSKDLTLTILLSYWIWSKLKRWRSWISGCPMSWLQIKKKKIIILKCHLLLFFTTENHFSIRLWHVTKSGFYTTTRHYQLGGWTEEQLQSTSQSQTWTKKMVMVTVWWSAAVLIHYSFLNSGETMTSEKCSENWWDTPKTAMSALRIGQQKGPSSSPCQCLTACFTTSASQVEQTGPQTFASSTIFTWPRASRLPLLQVSQQLFAGNTLPQLPGDRKCFPRVSWILKHGFLCYMDKQTYFSLAKIC